MDSQPIKLEKAKQLIARVYEFNPVGGNLHVQLDDGNLEDQWFEKFDPWFPEASKAQLAAERECFDFLKSMTYEERCAAVGMDPEEDD